MVEVTQRTEFECAYFMYPQDSQGSPDYRMKPMLNCHHYKVSVTAQGNCNRSVLIEFSKFKDIISEALPKNQFLYYSSCPQYSEEFSVSNVFQIAGNFATPCNFVVCAENLVTFIATEIQSRLNSEGFGDVTICKVVLQETANSSVSWQR